MKDFKTLEVWERAHMLAQSVYMLVEECPALVRYGLAPPMQRAGIDIAAKIAEGCGRSGMREPSSGISTGPWDRRPHWNTMCSWPMT